MAVVLGLASALVYGAADFMGGVASKRSGAFAVVVWSQAAGLVALVVAVRLLGQPVPTGGDLAWGALGGIGGGAGVVLLYRALSIGTMAVVASTAAVGGAGIPVLVGLGLGERPAVTALVGVVVALVAIVLVSSTPHEDQPVTGRLPAGLAEAGGAGIGFALFFVCLANTSADAGLWPLVTARVSIMVALVAALLTRSPLRVARREAAPIVAVGVLDMLANLLYLFATREGLLSLVAVLVSLYPATTVLLARFFLRERLSGPQLVGLFAAAAGVALIAL